MRRSANRRTVLQKSIGLNSSSATSDPYRSGRSVSKEMENIEILFGNYADISSGDIEPAGIESLCSDISISHTDVRMLLLAWKTKAKRQGYFSQYEWCRGLKALRADTLAKLKKALSDLEKEVRSPQNFLDFYSYAFRYCLADIQKNIDLETACELLNIVLASQFPSQTKKLIEFIKFQHEYKVINMDQWTGFLRFCNEINFPSLDNYDSTLAWPLILDNFVEWMLERQN
ncbi:hypothetical protein ZOSMA_16G01380 [Zostera marina]|uniref:Defective in cullin neddylation protein n=1 Tax=Zostera marina TaxID=29655 RepID=A0A0K9PT08_ZOSMR|nr:hypothetical protein ZOSMA_16G01380 [Zostera marina]